MRGRFDLVRLQLPLGCEQNLGCFAFLSGRICTSILDFVPCGSVYLLALES
jgi:hypothetical protein